MARVYCDHCKKRCRGNVLKVINSFFHKECFRCSKCKCSLETGGFFKKNNQFYCQEDFRSICKFKCKVCDSNLTGDIISAFSYSFHKSCFMCSSCKSPFEPGDSVTVCNTKFFCASCSKNLPNSMKTAHKHSLSFADQNASLGQICNGKNGLSANITIPKSQSLKSTILKSSLRHSENKQDPPPGDHGYISADSDAGDGGVVQLKQNGTSTLPVSSCSDTRNIAYPTSQKSKTLNSENYPYPGGHHLRDYNRFSYLSSTNVNDQSFLRSSDLYRRTGTNSASLTSSAPKLHHFHIPEGPLRFSTSQNRIKRDGHFFISSLSDALAKLDASTRSRKGDLELETADSGHNRTSLYSSPLSNSGMANSEQLHSPPMDSVHPQMTQSYRSDRETSLEARRLASYPSGHPRDINTPPAIDRYDWPAPACTAVILAELMRERRQRRKTEARLSGSVDYEDSQEDLSLDASIESPYEAAAAGLGIERAILLEEEQKNRKSKSLHPLDPISASRSPNANIEPSFKTRYATHSFASPSREMQKSPHMSHRLGYSLDFINSGNRTWTGDSLLHSRKETIRPGYTEGKLTIPSVTSSLPCTSLFSFNGKYGIGFGKSSEDCVKFSDLNEHTSSTLRQDVAKFPPLFATSDSFRLNETGDTSYRDFSGSGNCNLTYPVGLPSTLSTTVSKLSPPDPLKEHSYNKLISYEGKFPQGIDRVKLETYLSNSEFESVLGLTRIAFYRLPEWKRNDLKRRVELF